LEDLKEIETGNLTLPKNAFAMRVAAENSSKLITENNKGNPVV
jgi:hypothetical protein